MKPGNISLAKVGVIDIAYRNIVITQNAKVSSKDNQLKIDLDFDEQHSIPIEDISTVMIEHQRVQLSSYAMQRLVQNGTVVYFCDEQHLPCGVLLPLSPHSRQLKILHSQLSVTKPLMKRAWQQIIQQKVSNQAECLKLSGNEGYHELLALSKKVQSGDSTYIEAQAAGKYFKLLFGTGFFRNKGSISETDITNSALNYGYSIIRGAVARSLVVYGFETSLGIFHHSETNRFNLADDLLEPFRPLIDLYVFNNIEGDKLTARQKYGLYEILNHEIDSGNEKHSVMYSIERLVKSLSSLYQNNNGQLVLPKLLPLKIHTYE